MNKARCWMILVLMVSFLLSSHPMVFPKDFEEFKPSLKGLEEISLTGVEIDYFTCWDPSKLEEARTKYESIMKLEEEMEKYVEMRIKKAGIRTVSWSEEWKEPKRPKRASIRIIVNIRNIPPDYFRGDFELRILQSVYLERTRGVGPFLGMTYWTVLFDSGFEPPPKDEIQHIRNGVKTIVDRFIEDYLSENPK